MEIVVCIKQVPDVDNIKWTKENNLDRTNMLSKLNPYDDMALNWALKIKKRIANVHITAISMGPIQAKEILNYALAKGADRALLLCDNLFAGSDTLVTSEILSKAIKKYVPDFDLVLTGVLAPDGDTKQVPVSLSAMLDILDYENVFEINESNENEIIFCQNFDSKILKLKANYPLLISVSNYNKEEFLPKINDYINAQNLKAELISASDLDFNKDRVGISGSPTVVYKVFRPDFSRNTVELKENHIKYIVEFINEAKR